MEDKSNNKEQSPHMYTRRNLKRHISLVSLLLCCKIAAVWCFVFSLGLWMWAGSEAGSEVVRQLDKISIIYNFFISSHLKMFNAVRWTNTIL